MPNNSETFVGIFMNFCINIKHDQAMSETRTINLSTIFMELFPFENLNFGNRVLSITLKLFLIFA